MNTLRSLLFCLFLAILHVTSAVAAQVTVYDFGASWCIPCREDIRRDNDNRK